MKLCICILSSADWLLAINCLTYVFFLALTAPITDMTGPQKLRMSSCIILTLKWWHLCVQVYGNTYSPLSRTVQDKLILKSYFKSLHYCLSSILWLFAVSLPSRKNMRMCSNHELFWVFCYLTLSFGTGKRGNIVTMDPIAPVTSRAS